MSHDNLKNLLIQLNGHDTNTVMGALDQLREYINNQNSVEGLFRIYSEEENYQVRFAAGVVLNNAILKQWVKADPVVRENVKYHVLNILSNEKDKRFRSNAANLFCSIVRISIPTELMKIDEFWEFIFQLILTGGQEHKETALYIIEELSTCMIFIMKAQISGLIDIFMKTMDPSESLDIRVRSSIAAGSVIYYMEEEEEKINDFHNVIPFMIETAKHCLEQEHDETMSAFDAIGNILESMPHLIEQHFIPVAQLCISTGLNQNYSWNIRFIAMTLIQLMIKYKPVWFVRNGLVTDLIDVVIKVGLEGIVDSDDPQDCPFRFSCNTIEFISQYIKPKHTYTYFINCVQDLSQSNILNYKLMAIGILRSICVGYYVNMVEDLPKFIPYIQSCFEDPHYEMKRQICILLGKFSKHLIPEVLSYHDQFIPWIIKSLTEDNIKVQETACYSLMSYVEHLDSTTIQPYLDDSVKILVGILERVNDRHMQEMVITSLSTVASSAKGHFLPYFDVIISILKEFVCLHEPNSILVRARAIDAVGNIAKAVGRDVFMPYADYFMKHAFDSFLLDSSTSNSKGEYIDLKECVYNYFANISETLCQQYEPYLDLTMQHTFATLEDQGEDDEASNQIDSLLQNNDTLLSIKKALKIGNLDEKISALQCIAIIARSVNNLFLPYLEKSVEFANEMSLYVFPSARSISNFAMECFMVCLDTTFPPKNRGQCRQFYDENYALHPNAQSFLDTFITTLIDRIVADSNCNVVISHLSSLIFLIDNYGIPGIHKHFDNIINVIYDILVQNINSLDELADEIENEETLQEAFNIFDNACDVIIKLSELYGDNMLNPFDKLLPPLVRYIDSEDETLIEHKHIAIGAIASVIENIDIRILTKDKLAIYLAQAFKGVQDEESGFRMNATYLLGTLMRSPHTFPHYDKCIEALLMILMNDDNDRCLDNACGAIGIAILTETKLVPLDQVLPIFFERLPLREDHEEDEKTYISIVHLIEQQNPSILPFIPKVVTLFVDVIGDDQVDIQLKERLAPTIKYLWANFQQDLKPIVDQMSNDQLEIFEKCI